ncbi:MAG: response regulator transcription factor [Thermoanaerobaculum sp.]
MRVLVVEDDSRLRDILKRQLERQGLAVDTAGFLSEADELLALHDYHLLILDRRLPDGDGLDLCRTLRERGFANAILVLTALGDPQATVEGLTQGADDYLAKPFELAVLLARVTALLRRVQRGFAGELRFGNLRLDLARRELSWNGTPVPLTARELAVVETLLRAPGAVVTRDELFEHAWGEPQEALSNTLEVLISRIRRKLSACGATVKITSIRGLGYRLE